MSNFLLPPLRKTASTYSTPQDVQTEKNDIDSIKSLFRSIQIDGQTIHSEPYSQTQSFQAQTSTPNNTNDPMTNKAGTDQSSNSLQELTVMGAFHSLSKKIPEMMDTLSTQAKTTSNVEQQNKETVLETRTLNTNPRSNTPADQNEGDESYYTLEHIGMGSAKLVIESTHTTPIRV